MPNNEIPDANTRETVHSLQQALADHNKDIGEDRSSSLAVAVVGLLAITATEGIARIANAVVSGQHNFSDFHTSAAKEIEETLKGDNIDNQTKVAVHKHANQFSAKCTGILRDYFQSVEQSQAHQRV